MDLLFPGTREIPEGGDMTRDDSKETGSSIASRRTFLKVAGAGAVVGGLANYSLAQGETIELGGEVQGWQGQQPSEIEGETNPTLRLEPGTEYEVVWENLDGQPHDFVIRDDDGQEVVGTEIVSEEGATTSLSFTASEEISTYVCTVHPSSMRGEIQIGEGTETTPGEEDQQVIPEGPTVGLQQVADGTLTAPVDFDVANEDRDRRFIVDQVGQIYVHGPDGIEEEPFLDLTDRIVEVGTATDAGFDERGVLGLAFHPDFAENGQFYVRYSAPPREGTPEDYDHTFVLSEFTTTDDGERGDPDSERTLLELPEPQFNHNAGAIAFGPDGYLYVTVGDGGDADDTGLGHVEDWYDENEGGNGQDLEQNLLGSILRIDVDGEGEETPYAIPEDNPLVDGPGLPEHYAWGFRNPWRMSFNDGDLFVADVGQNLFEEVSVVENGGNYGWNIKEATHCFSTENPSRPPEDCPDTAPDEAPYDGQELIDPIIEYPHFVDDQTVGISITGGYVYQGDAIPELQGTYVFGDWSRSFTEPDGRLFAARPPEEGGETPGGTTTTPGDGMTDTETPTDGTPTDETPTDGTPTDGTPTETGTPTGTETPTEGDGTPTESEMAFQDETPTETPTEAGTPTETGTPTGTETPTEAGTETPTATPTPEEEDEGMETPAADLEVGGPDLWNMVDLVVEGAPDGDINRFVLSFGRDRDGELYVLTNAAYVSGDTGVVYKIVPPEEGDEIETETPIPTPTPGEETPTPDEGTPTPGETTTEPGTKAAPETTPGEETPETETTE
jgi:glucose/arabinose dehydrogenase